VSKLEKRIVVCTHCAKKFTLPTSVTEIPKHKRLDNPSEPCDGEGYPITKENLTFKATH